VQIHGRKTPLGADVDFRALAERYPASGGDIKNAVLKAAQMAIAEEGADEEKRIGQRHFEAGIEEVIGARRVMDQSLFGAAAGMLPALAEGGMDDEVATLTSRLMEVEDTVADVPAAIRRLEESHARSRAEAERERAALAAQQKEVLDALREGAAQAAGRAQLAVWISVAAAVLSAAVAALTLL
jgi:hypothetical protein